MPIALKHFHSTVGPLRERLVPDQVLAATLQALEGEPGMVPGGAVRFWMIRLPVAI